MSSTPTPSLEPSRRPSRRPSRGNVRFDWARSSLKRSFGADQDDAGSGGGVANANANNPQVVSRYLKRMSGLVVDPIELDLDQRRLRNAVREAGEHSFDVAAISVWMMNEENGKLFMPAGGWWRSPEMEDADGNVALARLEDKTRIDYVPPKPVSPGTDIVGILWTESKGGTRALSHNRSSLGLDESRNLGQSQEKASDIVTMSYQPIRWRDIPSISQDPDSATTPRLRLMEEAGFTMATGITFQYLHHTGMVMFLTTVKDKNDNRLTCVSNNAFLHQAAQFIGATMSFSEIRRATLAERHCLKERCYSIRGYTAKDNPETSLEEGKGGESTNQAETKGHATNTHMLNHHLPPHVVAWLHKMKGGSMQAPPSLSWNQTAWTIFGCFVGLLVLSSLNEYYRLLSDDEYYLIIGPFGAMCTLMYGLSAAPASQPRNAVLGQAVAGAVSLAFTYIPENILPVWLRLAVGPAFAIGAMVKLGLVHPPAGAHSVLYATGQYNFGLYGLVVLSTAISVIPATMVNNMSSKRQYPTYWGISDIGLVYSWICKRFDLHSHDKQVMKSIMMNETGIALDGRENCKDSQPDRLVIHEKEEEDSCS